MNPFDSVPLWLLALLMVGTLSVVIEVGYQAGKRIASEKGLAKHPVEAAVSTAMLGLLAFMLAFTFGAVVSRSKEGRLLAVTDMNNTVTLHRLTDLMQDPEKQEEFRALLEEYRTIRSEAIEDMDPAGLATALNRSRDIQDRLWDLTLSDGDSLPPEMVRNLLKFIETDTSRRATGLYNRLPMMIWYTLAGLTMLTTGLLGMNSGLHGRRSRLVATVFIVAYSLVLLLIVDLDRPFRTLFKSEDANAERALEDLPEGH